MFAFSPTNSRYIGMKWTPFSNLLLLIPLLVFWVNVSLAQTGGGLGCLVDAGIDYQEVCEVDHISLGGTPLVDEALAGEVARVR